MVHTGHDCFSCSRNSACCSQQPLPKQRTLHHIVDFGDISSKNATPTRLKRCWYRLDTISIPSSIPFRVPFGYHFDTFRIPFWYLLDNISMPFGYYLFGYLWHLDGCFLVGALLSKLHTVHFSGEWWSLAEGGIRWSLMFQRVLEWLEGRCCHWYGHIMSHLWCVKYPRKSHVTTLTPAGSNLEWDGQGWPAMADLKSFFLDIGRDKHHIHRASEIGKAQ